MTRPEIDLRQAVAAALELNGGEIGDDANLIQLGMDSIRMMRLAGRWRRAGLDIGFAELAAEPTLTAWQALLAGRSAGPAPGGPSGADIDESAPFDLALMQHAYWVGRAEGQRLGGVAAHFYNEFDGTGIEPARLEQAVRAVLARHGMLRVRVLDDGTQRILPESPWPGLRVHDLRALSVTEAERELAELRRRLSHRGLDIAAAEVFDVQLSLLPQGIRADGSRVHVNLDMIAADALSLRVLLADLARCYRAPGDPLPALDYSYPRYLRDRAASTDAEVRLADREHWQRRLPELPGAPQLPVAALEDQLSATTVMRRHRVLDAGELRRFNDQARGHGLTPAMALAAVFAETLTAWSTEPRFLLNLPLFDREPLHPHVGALVGDFTSSVLLEWDGAAPGSFAGRAAALQSRFHTDAAHARYSGVEVLRDLSRSHGERVLAPVVYTSAIGLGELFPAEVRDCFGEAAWIISQGPQVWLDAQVTEFDGGLLVNWDAREAAFAPGVLDAMFAAYSGLLDRLLSGATGWSAPVPPLLPDTHLAVRAAVNATTRPRSGKRLHDGFFDSAAGSPDAVALLWGKTGSMSYGELARRALRVGGHLRDHGVRPGDLVAVSLPKGPDQIVGVLGVLAAGAAYLPIGVDQPPLRRERIHRTARVRAVLDDLDGALRAQPLAGPLPGSDAELAYVLYTSGSTGDPKGVEIAHSAAMNTVDDLNKRFGLGASDRTLALSALEFDLSVFDIFGALSVGGAVVCVDEADRRDAIAWVALARRHSATVLNCVPSLLDMVLTAAGDNPDGIALRVVLLGGDWVTLDLPGRLCALVPDCRFVALGGTTETAIHSTICEVTGDVPAHWNSVPYGRPLANVRCRVVDPLGRDCPNWVPGELWIGGAGVARGYRGDSARSAEKFVEVSGVRYYRTGDRARCWPDGTLEFLGRADHQVKVRGHRIELGEIEAALTAHPVVAQGIAVVCADHRLGAAVTVAGPVPQAVPVDPVAENGADDRQEPLVSAYLTHLMGLAPSVSGRFDRVIRLWRHWLGGRQIPAETWPVAQSQVVGTWLAPIADALDTHAAKLAAVLRGDADSISLVDSPVSPEAVLTTLPDTEQLVTALVADLTEQSQRLRRPVRLVEIDARTGMLAERLLTALPPDVVQYTSLHVQAAHLAAARRRFSGLPHDIRAHQLDHDLIGDDLRHAFDVALSFCSPRTRPDPAGGTALAALLLAPGATFWLVEQPMPVPLELVAAVGAETELDRFEHVGEHTDWPALLAAAGLEPVTAVVSGRLIRMRARRPADAPGLNAHQLKAFLAERLPAVMVPDRIAVLPRLPLTPNGKIDRRVLRQLLGTSELGSAEPAVPPIGEVERRLARVWSELLGVPDIGRKHDFFALGGDSLLATRMVGRLRAAGLTGVTLAELFTKPVLADFATTMRLGAADRPALVADPANRHKPFGPTDVQRAYWLGRSEEFTLGGIGCHYYREYDVLDLDPARLETAINVLVERHEMLRAVLDERGDQRILTEVPRLRIPVVDAGPDPEAAFDELRRSASHQVFDPSVWPLFSIRAVRLGRRTRLAIGVDNIVLDALSILIFYAELAALYDNPDGTLPPVGMSFRDYLLGAAPSPESVAAARDYWIGRLADLPPAPRLPLATDPAEVRRPWFTRHEGRIEAGRWRVITDRAREHGLTPSAILLTAFADVLSAWSAQPDLTLTLTLFDRREVHLDVNNVLGDFTSLMLLAHRPVPGESWLARTRRLQEELWRSLDHRAVSSVWVQRELARATGEAEVTMPVVFTSALGVPGGTAAPERGPFRAGNQVWGISQTPQVWLDHQVTEVDGGVSVNWDVVEELFPDGLIETMFAAYLRLLNWLGEAEWTEPAPDLLPAGQREARAAVNATGGPLPNALLHQAFFERAAAEPDRPALLWGSGGSMSYRELADRALRLAALLGEYDLARGEPVAVNLPKGPEQIVAVLGVLAAGGVYLPVGVDQPAARRERIHRLAGARLVITDDPNRGTAGCRPVLIAGAAALPPTSEPVSGDPDQLAYVIFTSGSTGDPKGVEITHRAALNTIVDINERFGIGRDDRVLAVSALDFDLSVYDIFGLLSAGGAVVTIDERSRRDARRWAELIGEHGVTVWNTVPALLDMLLIVLEARPGAADSLRLVLVSGDWVGLDLPGRLATCRPGCRFIALGGATEAAIWSNFHEVVAIDPDWRSVPYGCPLRNQRFRVVDGHGRDCPDWVPGELWIGGAGVARGYRSAPEVTARQFVGWQGERWYRTGDLGRYWPNGTLEFLGRADHQVKIRGHRIELGEIEAALANHPGVGHAIAGVAGERGSASVIAAVVPSESDTSESSIDGVEPPARVLAERAAALAGETAAARSVLVSLLGMDVLGAGGTRSVADIAAGMGLADQHLPTVRLWLRWLVEAKVIVRDGQGFRAGPELAAALAGEGLGLGAGEYGRLIDRAHRSLVDRMGDYRDILAGRLDPEVLLDDEVLAPANLADSDPGTAAALREIAHRLTTMAAEAPLEIAELDGRAGRFAARLLDMLPPERVRYTLLDPAPAMVAEADRRLDRLPHWIHCRRFAGDRVDDELSHRFDVVIANNVLHRYPDPARGLTLAALLTRQGGELIAVEREELTPIALLTAGLLDRGYADLDPERRTAGTPTLPGDAWARLCLGAGFREVTYHPLGTSFSVVLRARRPDTAVDLDPLRLKEHAAALLPAHMVPERIAVLPALPLSANGKVDRSGLAGLLGGGPRSGPAEPPRTELERAIAELWSQLLGVSSIGRGHSFFELGGDSLQGTRFIETVRQRFDVELPLRRLFAGPTLAEVAAVIEEARTTDEFDEGEL